MGNPHFMYFLTSRCSKKEFFFSNSTSKSMLPASKMLSKRSKLGLEAVEAAAGGQEGA